MKHSPEDILPFIENVDDFNALLIICEEYIVMMQKCTKKLRFNAKTCCSCKTDLRVIAEIADL